MAQLEKVIQGLECWLDDDAHCPDDDCPYMKRLVCDQAAILHDAISLLKAQEPRVFDADEIVLSAEPSGWLWLEMKNGRCGEAYKAGRTIGGFINFGNGFYPFFTSLFPEDYGKTWRCWTSRPGDEQREATQWAK